jgi:predicted nucleotidyltransferase
MDQKDVITNVKKYVSFLEENEFPVQEAYIFGSYARGNAHEDSDIDLALVIKNLQNSFLAQVQLMKLRRDFDLRIEPHPFNETDFNPSHPFANEIISTGIRIH